MRDFVAADQNELRLLILAGLEERWGDAFDPLVNSDLDDVEASYVSRGAEVVVVETDGDLVATGTLVPDGPHRGRIVRMSVSAMHRREGFARRVVEELVERARRRGMCEVRVLADTPWVSAVALYRSCGFVEVSRDEADTEFVMTL